MMLKNRVSWWCRGQHCPWLNSVWSFHVLPLSVLVIGKLNFSWFKYQHVWLLFSKCQSGNELATWPRIGSMTPCRIKWKKINEYQKLFCPMSMKMSNRTLRCMTVRQLLCTCGFGPLVDITYCIQVHSCMALKHTKRGLIIHLFLSFLEMEAFMINITQCWDSKTSYFCNLKP